MAEADDRLARLEVLLTEMDRRWEVRVDALETRMVEGFAAISQRIDDTNARITDLNHALSSRMDGLDTRLLAIEGRLTMIERDKANK